MLKYVLLHDVVQFSIIDTEASRPIPFSDQDHWVSPTALIQLDHSTIQHFLLFFLLDFLFSNWQSSGWQEDGSPVSRINGVFDNTGPAHIRRATTKDVPKFVDCCG